MIIPIFLLFSFLKCSESIDLDANKVIELLNELVAHPKEVIQQLEKYRTSELIAALGLNAAKKTKISELCHEELSFLGYGMIDIARNYQKISPEAMTDEERKQYFIPMVDSAGKLGSGIARGHILSAGQFGECKGVKIYSTTLKRVIQGDYYRILFDIKMRPNSFNDSCSLPQIGVDMCLPYSCRNEDLTEYFRSIIGVNNDLSPVCRVVNVNQRLPPTSTGTWVLLPIISFLVLTSIVAGSMDYMGKFEKSRGFGWKVLCSFSLYRNIKEIFNIENLNKPGQISSINCIRTISTIWVILGHCASILLLVCTNPLDFMDFGKTYTGLILSNAFFAVDTFFFISAFLLSFLWFKSVQKHRSTVLSTSGWIMFYVHRITRISPVYYITILFYTFIYTRFVSDMPIFMSPMFQDDTCAQNYWLNLLYINNIVDTKNICYVVSWYLATDFQLYILSPLILLPFAISGPILGIIVSSILFLLSTLFNAYQIYFWYFPPTDYAFGPKHPKYDADQHRYETWNYYNPLIRCQIYIMGLVLGYFMQKIPKMNINAWLDRAMWILSLGSMVFVIMVIQNNIDGNLWPPFQAAMYSCLSRPLWGLSLSWILLSTYYRPSLINDFMSLPFWTPIARLSFSTYLIHIMVAGYFFGKNHSELYFHSLPYFFMDTVIPVTFISFILSIFWSSIFELPFAKIIAMLLNPPKTPKMVEKKIAPEHF